ncbi:hypothetical protein EOL94_00215 [bacterium]|nr:hypothetical protein [bacterium]
MKKIAILLAVLFAVLCTFAQTTNSETTATEQSSFNLVYNQVMELNSSRFQNLDLIQIGDTVLFPSRTGEGLEFWVADAPQGNVHDCIWRLTEKYLSQEIVTKPVITPTPKPVIESSNIPSWITILLGILAAGILILLLIISKRNEKRNVNPDYYPPVMDSLENKTTEEVVSSIQEEIRRTDPDGEILEIQRGYLVRRSGPKYIEVHMEFGDRNGRIVRMKSGEKVTRVLVKRGKETSYEYWREHCGNKFAVIKDGRVELPEGWLFAITEEAEVEQTTEDSGNSENENRKNPEPTKQPDKKKEKLDDGEDNDFIIVMIPFPLPFFDEEEEPKPEEEKPGEE